MTPLVAVLLAGGTLGAGYFVVKSKRQAALKPPPQVPVMTPVARLVVPTTRAPYVMMPHVTIATTLAPRLAWLRGPGTGMHIAQQPSGPPVGRNDDFPPGTVDYDNIGNDMLQGYLDCPKGSTPTRDPAGKRICFMPGE